MAKKTDSATTVDLIACAESCEKSATEIVDAYPNVAQQLRDAARLLKAVHSTLTQVDCLHTITFTVTQAMIDIGREERSPGKYCMLCGALMPKPEKPNSTNQPKQET